jgi:hypothetical protein
MNSFLWVSDAQLQRLENDQQINTQTLSSSCNESIHVEEYISGVI